MDQRLQLADQLLLAQAVHHIGTTPPEWERVSRLILEHPLVVNEARAREFAQKNLSAAELFSPSACETNWGALMRMRGIIDATRMPRTDRQSQLALAQLLYADRIVEIQAQIHQREQHFRYVATNTVRWSLSSRTSSLASWMLSLKKMRAFLLSRRRHSRQTLRWTRRNRAPRLRRSLLQRASRLSRSRKCQRVRKMQRRTMSPRRLRTQRQRLPQRRGIRALPPLRRMALQKPKISKSSRISLGIRPRRRRLSGKIRQNCTLRRLRMAARDGGPNMCARTMRVVRIAPVRVYRQDLRPVFLMLSGKKRVDAQLASCS